MNASVDIPIPPVRAHRNTVLGIGVSECPRHARADAAGGGVVSKQPIITLAWPHTVAGRIGIVSIWAVLHTPVIVFKERGTRILAQSVCGVGEWSLVAFLASNYAIIRLRVRVKIRAGWAHINTLSPLVAQPVLAYWAVFHAGSGLSRSPGAGGAVSDTCPVATFSKVWGAGGALIHACHGEVIGIGAVCADCHAVSVFSFPVTIAVGWTSIDASVCLIVPECAEWSEVIRASIDTKPG